MALTSCRECGSQVSDEAVNCPHCGAPYPSRHEWKGTGIDYKSQTTVYGYPLVHVAFGRNQKGKRRVAKGVIAIGQYGIGIITIAQFGIGIVFGCGQFILGLTGVAQFMGALILGIGQFATGFIVIGQFVVGYYGLAQLGAAMHLLSPYRQDPEAVQFFSSFWDTVKQWLRIQ
jgi:hypothetical protein